MNKTFIALGVGIWGVMLLLRFIFSSSLGSVNLSAAKINDILFPLVIIEIVAFFIALFGLFKNE